jgi:hypothetical protein
MYLKGNDGTQELREQEFSDACLVLHFVHFQKLVFTPAIVFFTAVVWVIFLWIEQNRLLQKHTIFAQLRAPPAL